MIERVVFLPMPPLIDPAIANGAATELDELRTVIDDALSEAVAATNTVAVLGTDETVEVANYLLSRVAPRTTALPMDLSAEPNDATVLLVMGDGTAKRTEKAPGYIDDRAEAFDRRVSEIFKSAQLAELAMLDQELAEELWVAGVIPWKSVGGWVEEFGSSWKLRQLHFEDPYGVAYFVADFEREH